MKKTMWDLKEDRLEQRLQALAQQGDWDGVVQALDDYDKNNDRRHEDRRDDFDLSCLNGGISADGHYQIPESLKLYEEDDWLDIIFSQQAGDLPNLVAEYPVSQAMRELTPQQQEISSLASQPRTSPNRWGVPPGTSPSSGRRRWRRFAFWSPASRNQKISDCTYTLTKRKRGACLHPKTKDDILITSITTEEVLWTSSQCFPV